MVKVVRMTAAGGPEVLRLDDLPLAEPGAGEVRVRHAAIGVNFVDIYVRKGLYPAGDRPAPLGVEAAGVVEAVGDGVGCLSPGDRVAYAGLPPGSYAEARTLPAARLLKLPAGLSLPVAAAGLLRGLTAHMLLFRVFPVGPGTVVLVHAAAGGLGGILVRWAKRLGAEVIGTVGNTAKAEMARVAGADHVIVGRDGDIAAAVADFTHGRGVDYAIDGIGGETLAKTLACVRKFGMVASIGQAAGPIPPVPVEALGPVRSLALSRPSVLAFASEPDIYRAAGTAVLDLLASGLAAPVGGTYPLAGAAAAHADLESGRTSGSLLLIP